MIIPFADMIRAYEAFESEYDRCIREVNRSGHYILGKNGAALEDAIAEYIGVKHAVGCGSGTDALHLAIVAAGIGPGDEVITTPFTFAATVEAIEYVGATPVLVDIEADTFNIDPNRIEDALTDKTAALLPVHLFGQPANMIDIMDIAARNELLVIEDCAQSLGSTVGSSASGSLGVASAFSFYPTKTLGCFGDGGMVATDDPDVDRRLRMLRHHGNDGTGEHVILGFNSRLDESQAAVLRIKLPHLDEMNANRQRIGERYNAALADTPAQLQQPLEGVHRVYGYYTLCIDNRDAVRSALQEAGISTSVYYMQPLHRHSYFSKSCKYGAMPVAETASERCLSLPIFPEMTDEEVDYVTSTLVGLIG